MHVYARYCAKAMGLQLCSQGFRENHLAALRNIRAFFTLEKIYVIRGTFTRIYCFKIYFYSYVGSAIPLLIVSQ